MKIDYTRDELIEICEKAFVHQDKWGNRDSAMSQSALGECYAFLKAGCYFEIQTKEPCNTDERTIWIQFWVKDFSYFEGQCSDKRGRDDMDYHFYIPTMERLNATEGRDWY